MATGADRTDDKSDDRDGDNKDVAVDWSSCKCCGDDRSDDTVVFPLVPFASCGDVNDEVTDDECKCGYVWELTRDVAGVWNARRCGDGEFRLRVWALDGEDRL